MKKSLSVAFLGAAVVLQAIFPAGMTHAQFSIDSFGGGSSFGSPSFGTPSFGGGSDPYGSYGTPTFGGGSNPTFGSPSFGTPSFGGGSTGSYGNPSFGGGTTGSTFGNPTFGTPTFGGGSTGGTPTFGNPTFGTPTFGGGTTPTFGDPTFGNPTITPIGGGNNPPVFDPNPPVFFPPTITPIAPACYTFSCDFSISLSPSATQTVTKPGTLVYQVNVTGNIQNSNAISGRFVNLSYSDDDSGINGALGNTRVSIGAGTSLTVAVASAAINGFHTIIVTGNNGYVTRSASAGLLVNGNIVPPPPTGFAPVAVTSPASGVSQTSAVLNGIVTPNGASTSYWFEYGTNASLGQNTGVFSAGSGNSGVSVSASANNLSPNTTYYFRVVAQNQFGTSQGQIFSFTTSASTFYQATLTIVPNSATINSGETYSFRAFYDVDGSSGPQAAQDVTGSASWFSNNTAVATLISQGQFRGNAGGVASVTVAYSGLVNVATLVVNNISSGSAPSAQTNSATGVSQTSASLNGTINPNGASTSYWFEYGTTSSLGNQTASQSAGSGTGSVNASAFIASLASNTTYYFRVVAQNQFGTSQGQVLSFTTSGQSQGSVPTVSTNSATGVSQNSATLNGTVNPNGSNTTYWFEYGINGSLNQTSPQSSIGSGTVSQSIFATVSNLSTNTTYSFRAVAQNQYGTSYGQTLTFVTSGNQNQGNAPIVQTNSATGVSQNSATLNGTVNPNGSNATYWFEYGTSASFGYSTGFQSAGSNTGNFNINSFVSGLASNTTYYFRAVAQNQYGTSYGQTFNFVTSGGGFIGGNAPYAQTNSVSGVGNTYATFNGNVTPNNADTYAWYEYGISPSSLVYTTNSSYIGSGQGTIPVTQNITNLQSNTTYYYRIVARNNNGTSYGQVVSFSTLGGGYNPPIYGNGQAPIVFTRTANFVYRNSALLTGDVNPNGGITSAWFQYGPTSALGLTTNQQPMGSGNISQSFVSTLSSLIPGTTYYFRAVAQNQYGTSYGEIRSLQTTYVINTPNPPVNPQPPVIYVPVGPTGGGTLQECVILTPTANVASVNAGQEFFFTITYRNGCSYPLTNAVLRVMLPAEIQFVSADNPYYIREGNGVTFNLGTVPANSQVSITIHAKVADDVVSGSTLITNNTLSFTDRANNFRSVNGILTLNVGEGRSLTASLFDVLNRLFGSCWFWFILLFLLFLIALLIMYRALSRPRDEVRRVDIMTTNRT